MFPDESFVGHNGPLLAGGDDFLSFSKEALKSDLTWLPSVV
jgi:hypothetical protein